MDKRTSFLILLIVLSVFTIGHLSADPAPPPPTVNDFDSVLMFPYSEPLSITSDVTQYISFFAPAAFAFVAPPSEWLEISLLYGTSALLSFGTRTLMKKTIERIRPYEYFPDSPEQPPMGEDDHDESFPSGHSIMAFTGAAFTHALFALRYPDSRYRMPVTIAAWTFASATAALRVASGNHFVTDVLAGAAIGSFFGFAVPYLAWKFLPSWQGDRISVAVGPTMMAMNIRF